MARPPPAISRHDPVFVQPADAPPRKRTSLDDLLPQSASRFWAHAQHSPGAYPTNVFEKADAALTEAIHFLQEALDEAADRGNGVVEEALKLAQGIVDLANEEFNSIHAPARAALEAEFEAVNTEWSEVEARLRARTDAAKLAYEEATNEPLAKHKEATTGAERELTRIRKEVRQNYNREKAVLIQEFRETEQKLRFALRSGAVPAAPIPPELEAELKDKGKIDL